MIGIQDAREKTADISMLLLDVDVTRTGRVGMLCLWMVMGIKFVGGDFDDLYLYLDSLDIMFGFWCLICLLGS